MHTHPDIIAITTTTSWECHRHSNRPPPVPPRVICTCIRHAPKKSGWGPRSVDPFRPPSKLNIHAVNPVYCWMTLMHLPTASGRASIYHQPLKDKPEARVHVVAAKVSTNDKHLCMMELHFHNMLVWIVLEVAVEHHVAPAGTCRVSESIF